jgi:hypothetical protein
MSYQERNELTFAQGFGSASHQPLARPIALRKVGDSNRHLLERTEGV